MPLQGLNKMLYRLLEAATKKALWLALGAYVITALMMQWGASRMNTLVGTQVQVLDLQLGYSPAEARAILDQYTPEALRFAGWFNITADTIYPIAYTALFVILMARLCRKVVPQQPAWRWLMLLPLPIPIIDYLENAGIVQLLWNYPNVMDGAIATTSFFTSLKWAFVGLTATGLVALAIAYLRTRVQARRAATSYRN